MLYKVWHNCLGRSWWEMYKKWRFMEKFGSASLRQVKLHKLLAWKSFDQGQKVMKLFLIFPCALFFETVLKNCWTVLSQKLSKNERNSEVKVIWKVKVRTIWTYPYASFSGFWRKYIGTVFLNWAKCNGLFETKQQFN